MHPNSLKNLNPARAGEPSRNPSGCRKKVFQYVDEILKQSGKEPIAELLKLIPTLRERDQAQIWLDILPYVHAKVKPMSDHEEDELDKLSTAELVKLVKDNLPEVG